MSRESDVREGIQRQSQREREWREQLRKKTGRDPLSKDGKVPTQEQMEKVTRNDYVREIERVPSKG